MLPKLSPTPLSFPMLVVMAGNAKAMDEGGQFSGSSMGSDVLQQQASRTFSLAPLSSKHSGLAPLNIKPLPFRPVGPVSVPIPVIHEPRKNGDDAASSSVGSTTEDSSPESDTDSDKLASAPSTPAGVAPPPPLRNIPHQTPDTSPQASRVFSQPLMVRPSPSQKPILRPINSNQSVKPIKIPSSIPQIAGMRRPSPFTVDPQFSKTSLATSAGSGTVIISNARQSTVNVSAGQPHFSAVSIQQDVASKQSVISSASHHRQIAVAPSTSQSRVLSREENSISPPLQTSTPKFKESLGQDKADGKSEGGGNDAKSEQYTKPEEEGTQYNLSGSAVNLNIGVVSGDNSVAQVDNVTEHKEIHSTNSDNNQMSRSRRALDFQTAGQLQRTASDNPVESRVHQAPQRSSSANPTVAISQSKSFTKRKPPRAPSRLLQKSISQKSSSSDLSDDSSLSDNSEGHDHFDPVMQQHRLVMIPRVGSVQTALPPLQGGRLPLPGVQSLHRNSSISTTPLPPISATSENSHASYPTSPGQDPGQDPAQLPSYYEASQTSANPANPMLPHGAVPPSRRYSGGMTVSPGHAHFYTFGGEEETTQFSQEEIHMSAMEGTSVTQMKTLALQYGVDYRDSGGQTPLMYAVLGNQPKMCETLIKLKATVNIADLSGVTPLLWATFHARPDIIRLLLKNGASVRTSDPDDRTAFHWAMRTPNIHCLKWLCKYSSVPEAINQPDKDTLTPLHWAVMSDQPSHVKMLLSTGKVNVNMQDSEGRAALNYAVLNFSPSCIRAILDHTEGAVGVVDMKGRTALHYACAEGSADCVRTLLSYKSCNLHAADNNGTTPLHWAAAADQAGLVQLLLRRGADRGQRDHSDNTPLDYAQQREHTDCVKILQSYGLRRPGSAMSLASHASINAALEPPTLDEHGHVVFKTVGRRFSFSRRGSVASLDRLPADGQAREESSSHSGGGSVRNAASEEQEEGTDGPQLQGQVESETSNHTDPGTTQVGTMEGVASSVSQEALVQRVETNNTESDNQNNRGHKSWLEILLCGCCKRHNRVTPL